MKTAKQKTKRDLNNQSRLANYRELCKILGFKVPVDGLITALSGLISIDVIKLDEHLNVPDGTSLAKYIEENYGKEAEQLTRDLI